MHAFVSCACVYIKKLMDVQVDMCVSNEVDKTTPVPEAKPRHIPDIDSLPFRKSMKLSV